MAHQCWQTLILFGVPDLPKILLVAARVDAKEFGQCLHLIRLVVDKSRRLRCEGCQPSRISPREGWQPSQRLFKHVTKLNKLLAL